jgi:dienelactone hydrolase
MNRILRILLSFWIALLAFAASASSEPDIRFIPAEGLLTDPVTIRVSGLRPGTRITILTSMQLIGKWRSHATFVSDGRGEVRLDRDAPVEGTYSGVDPMGLLWAMEAEPAAAGAAPPKPPDVREPVVTTFRVEQEGATVASGTYRRWWAKRDVRITDVRENGLVGQLFEPAARGPRPAILVLGGSEGGTNAHAAAGFASRGYVALALAYFQRSSRNGSLQNELVNVPLEYFLKATEWLQRQKSVDPRRLAVYGKSRGSEAALLLASIAPQYRVVLAGAPSTVSGAGVGRQYSDKPAWTYRGRPVPFAPNDLTLAQLRAGVAVAGGSIPIERSHAAVFLVSGGADTVSRTGMSTSWLICWSSASSSRTIPIRPSTSRIRTPDTRLVSSSCQVP